MRITTLGPVRPVDLETRPLAFQGARGERVTIEALEHDVLRVQLWPEGRPRLERTWLVVGRDGVAPREGRRRDDLSPFSCPPFRIEAGEGMLSLSTAKLKVRVTLEGLALSWIDHAGRDLASDLTGRAYAYDRAGRAVWHYLGRRPGEHYYGFGERAGPLDKSGMRMRMVNLDALGYNSETTDPLYKHIPFYITFSPQQQVAYGLFYDNLATAVFDLGREVDAYHGFYRYYQAEDGDLDYYLIYGPTIPEVVSKFTRLVGRMVLPPRWSLGYLGSSMTHMEMPDAQEQVKQFVESCQTHRIPCDLYHLSSGYSTGADGKRYVFTWNREKVPDPAGMVNHFHRAGIRLAANIKPALLMTHPQYEAARAEGLLVQRAEGGGPETSFFWGGEGSYLDFTNPATYAWWKRQVKEQLLDYGIDATWNDNNEYEVWDDEAICHGFGDPLRVSLLRPLMSLLMSRASFEAQQEAHPGKRPYVLTRAGCPGIQRYAQTWSGDNYTSWHTLRYNIPLGLGAGLSGLANTGHDVGGFAGFQPSPELFVRWVQNGVLHPRFTIHSWHLDGTINEPWMYPEVLPVIRQWIEFRYRLLPYLYTLLFRSAQTGEPLIRPLVYAFPEDERMHNESFDFLLGPNMLVASVLEEGARTRRVYLPAGVEWCDWYSGRWFAGGQEVELAAPLDQIPLLVPEGGIIPMGRVMRHIGAEPDDLRQALAFPKRQGRSAFTLVEDDGETTEYARGAFSEVELWVESEPNRLRMGAHMLRGGYPLSYDHVEFILPLGETRPVDIRPLEPEWADDAGRRHLVYPVENARVG